MALPGPRGPNWSLTMSDLRLFEPFALDPIEETFRTMMRPWRFEPFEVAPKIRVDLAEQNGNYTVRAEIPGVNKDDIDVRIDGNLVTISAEMKKSWDERKPESGGRVLRSERQSGYASRSFTLACPVDEAKADAHYADGILELTLPKKSTEEKRRLEIH